MGDAFLYLWFCSLRNRVRVRLRRLRQPRYLVGSIVGVLYLYSAFFRRSLRQQGPSAGGLQVMLDRYGGPVLFAGSVLVFVVAAAAWVLPGAGRPVEFSQPEVQFLFQAPVTRAQLLHYKLLRGQLGALFGSAVATLFLRPATFATAWTFLVGIWLLLAIVRLHFTGVALRRQSLAQHGASAVARVWLPVAVVSAAVAVLAVTLAADWPTLSAMTSGRAVFKELHRLAESGAARWVLFPFTAVVRLPLSSTPTDFLRALPAALAILLLNYVWVIRGDAAFEEASAAYAEKRATEKAAPGSVRRQAKVTASPFALGPTGRPETAIFWKNLIVLGRYASLKTLLRVVPILVVLALAFSRSRGAGGLSTFAATTCLVFGGFTILLGPQMMRNDLRQDLGNLAMLKTWPVRGATLLRGELLAPAAVLTLLGWLLIGAGAILAGSGQVFNQDVFALGERLSYAAAAMIIAPALVLSQLVVQNAIAVLFPAWVTVGTGRARGVDAMGQRMLMLAGILLTLVVSLLPGAILAGLVGWLIYMATETVPVVVPAFVIGAVVIAECGVAIEILGRVLDRTDVTALEPVE